MNFEAVIGLEIHIEMKTKSKMFSSAPVTFGDEPNTNVAPLDIAFPGAMPSINKQAVINAIRVCNALHMEIDNVITFDRKNYFYSDLAKGYQLTQHKRPIGKLGYVDIVCDGGSKRINIQRLHIEEDTCKQIHQNGKTYLDFNRSGIPLLEIVTSPDIRNGEQTMKVVEKIKSIVIFLNVSSGRMEEGSLRCDVNVSIRPIGSSKLNNKVEIKNISTTANIEKAIDYEIRRQEALLLSGNRIASETRRYDEKSKQTISMREKIEDIDYKYFTDANLPPIKLSEDFINEVIRTSPELPDAKLERYKKLGLSEKTSQLLINKKENCDFFDEVISYGVNETIAANWIIVDIQAILNKEEISLKDIGISPSSLAELIKFIEKGTISTPQARQVFDVMRKTNKDCETIVRELGLTLISNKEQLLDIIRSILDNNKQLVLDYKNGKTRVISYIIKGVMDMTEGKANPKITSELIIQEMEKR